MCVFVCVFVCACVLHACLHLTAVQYKEVSFDQVEQLKADYVKLHQEHSQDTGPLYERDQFDRQTQEIINRLLGVELNRHSDWEETKNQSEKQYLEDQEQSERLAEELEAGKKIFQPTGVTVSVSVTVSNEEIMNRYNTVIEKVSIHHR